MSQAEAYMMTAEEIRLRSQKRRRFLLVVLVLVIAIVIGLFTARPASHAVKGWQARRHAKKAFVFIEQQKWQEARDEAVAAHQLDPSEPAAVRAIARLLSRTGQHEALEFWDQLQKVRPLTRDDLRDEASVALATGELERANVAIQKLTASDPSARDWLLATQLALQRNAADEAVKDADKVFADKTSSRREQLQASVFKLQASPGTTEQGQQHQAAAWKRINELADDDDDVALDALVLLARRALTSQTAEAKAGPNAEARMSNSQGNETSDVTHQRSQVSSQKSAEDSNGRNDKGNETSEAAVMGAQELIRALESHPLAKAQHKLLAVDLKIHEAPAEKEALISGATEDWKNADAASLATFISWLNGKGEYQRVLDTLTVEKALQNKELYLQYLDALGALARWDDIKRLLEGERFPLDPVIQRMYLARCNAQLGQKAAAENNWQRALEAAAGDGGKLLTLAGYAEKNGIADIADKAYIAATEQLPKSRPAWQGRLRMAQGQRDTHKIHDVLAQMLKLWPNDTAIQNDEAYTRLLLLGSNSARERSDVTSQRSEAGGTSSVSSGEKGNDGRNDEAGAGGQTSDVTDQKLKGKAGAAADAADSAQTSNIKPQTANLPNQSPSPDNRQPITDNASSSTDELIAIEHLAENLVKREPASLPHRTLLALARLRQGRPVAALEVYSGIIVAPNALSPSALAVHAAVLSANGNKDDAWKEIQQAPIEKLLPEEQAGTSDLRQ